MASALFSFELRHTDARTAARLSMLHTPHGPVELPAFMPVGTLGSVKGLSIDQVGEAGTQMLLANTYHLALRPGDETVAALGGLHRFSGFEGPILTDSGGFQLFSPARISQVTEEKAVFRSHIDGRLLDLSPEDAMAIQGRLGSDVAMVLDHVVALPNTAEVIRDATERSIRWAARCRQAAQRPDQAVFAIVQGGLDAEPRGSCARQLAAMDFEGYAVGGLSVGETHDEMVRTLDVTVPELPADRPRYLMGVGRPQDLLAAIARGIDLLDCVMPTRNGRNAMAFTDAGPLKMRNACHERDPRPLEHGCPCPACRHSRGYLRHLFVAREMLGPILLSIHNLTYYHRLMAGARVAIAEDRFAEFHAEKLRGWGNVGC